jgi:catechol 2,3-dioxygenase-like lactoylglutathione lyase family enzyme
MCPLPFKEQIFPMQMKLEVVMLPVTDVDRAKAFYVDQIGFHPDHDVQSSETMRVVQLTPPGSGCSVVIGTGMQALAQMQPGSIRGLHLVVPDAVAARDLLISRGVAVEDIIEYPGGFKFAGFSDPDGNAWVLQEIPPGR